MSIVNHHPTLYLKSGNLAILCKHRDGTPTYFRTDQRNLVDSSSVVKGMVDTLRYSPRQITYDGALLLEIQAAPADMALILSFIQNPNHVRNKLLADDKPDAAHNFYGVVELADTLKIKGLKQDVISRIGLDWPATLKAVDGRVAFYTTRNLDKLEDQRFPEPASVIKFSRRFDPSILNALHFYELSNRDRFANFGEKPRTRQVGLGARWDIATEGDIRRATNGRRKLLVWLHNELKNYDTQCSAPVALSSCKQLLQKRIHEVRVDISSRMDPLQILLSALGRERDDQFEDYKGACDTCNAKWVVRLKELRERLFEQIPNFY